MSKKYEAVIGLEVHVELKTKTKIFCGCKVDFASKPNTNVCPICLGLPGALPSLNKKVVEYAIMAGLSTNCSIRRQGRQDRKNYFYPDSPKAYQISQNDLPICYDGYLDISTGGREKRIHIERIHIEEDAGKLVYDGNRTLIDFNRAGTPLIEVVTTPSLSDEDQVVDFLQKLRAAMVYTGISDGKMNEGSFRCDVNISLREEGSETLGTRAEVKNLNSFNSIKKAIDYERKRKENMLKSGEVIVQETRAYDDNKEATYSMREKEEQSDYRYFPDPDLASIVVSDRVLNQIKDKLPELAEDRKVKYMEQYGLSSYDAGQLVVSKGVSDYFEECMKFTSSAKVLVNILISQVFTLTSPEDFPPNIPAEHLARLVDFLDQGRVSNSSGKKIIKIMNSREVGPEEIIKENNLEQINNKEELEELAEKAIASSLKAVKEYKGGKTKALQAIIGKVMKESRGRANPEKTKRILEEKLNNN